LSEAVPCTVAANWTVWPIPAELEVGEIVTEVTVEGGGVVVTVTVAEADLVESAALVAVTLAVPGVAGAV